jgi:phosphoglycolate phosphatase-like HAD superfamily hydrolase
VKHRRGNADAGGFFETLWKDARLCGSGTAAVMNNGAPWSIEVVHPRAPRGAFRFAVFDFDGTLSLIREGWQQIMIPYFTGELASCPGALNIPREELAETVRDFVYVNTGKQTIYQCIELAERVRRLGGKPLEPLAYKAEYHRRLELRIAGRVAELERDPSAAVNHVVPGSFDILSALKERGITMYLASGTDEKYVRQEAALLRVDRFFAGIYGAQDDYKSFSKKMVIERILRENDLPGGELLGFGDGYVEIENIKGAGGFACGVATDEVKRRGIDPWKRKRLTSSGADIIIPDFTGTRELMVYLFAGQA